MSERSKLGQNISVIGVRVNERQEGRARAWCKAGDSTGGKDGLLLLKMWGALIYNRMANDLGFDLCAGRPLRQITGGFGSLVTIYGPGHQRRRYELQVWAASSNDNVSHLRIDQHVRVLIA